MLDMAAAYILKSQSTGKFYVGSALNLDQRLAEHQRGHSPYTRNRGPWALAYFETLPFFLPFSRVPFHGIPSFGR